MKNTNFFSSLFLAFGLLVASFNSAQAHAFLKKADPGVGAQVTTSPTQITIWFTEGVEPAFSTIQVVNATGTRVDKNDTKLDAQDKSVLHVTIPVLPAGTYKVSWKVVAEDTHHTQGSFSFTIKS